MKNLDDVIGCALMALFVPLFLGMGVGAAVLGYKMIAGLAQ